MNTGIKTDDVLESASNYHTYEIYLSEFESRQGQEFSLLHVVQAGSGAHPTSYPMGTGGKSAGT
jgi:hypothetical protein